MLRIKFTKQIMLLTVLSLYSCAGTIKSQVNKPINPSGGKNAYIAENRTSDFIQNKYSMGGPVPMVASGVVVPMPTLVVEDGPTYQREKRGETEVHIKSALERHGFKAQIGPDGAIPEGTDIIIKYGDRWKWDLSWYLTYLRISFIDPNTGEELASGEFNNSPVHSFQTPGREVPRIIDSILQKTF